MTVAELVKALVECDPDAEVNLFVDEQETGPASYDLAVIDVGNVVLMNKHDAESYIKESTGYANRYPDIVPIPRRVL
jgi:hypothetical protein